MTSTSNHIPLSQVAGQSLLAASGLTNLIHRDSLKRFPAQRPHLKEDHSVTPDITGSGELPVVQGHITYQEIRLVVQ